VAEIVLQPGKERPVVQRHPWLFSGAISGVRGRPAPGEAVDVLASSGEWLARGMWSGASQIRARLVTWQPDEPIDSRLLAGRIERALEARERLGLLAEGQACRLVYAESDGLPGLIVDRYGDTLVAQFLSAGAERWKSVLADALLAATGLVLTALVLLGKGGEAAPPHTGLALLLLLAAAFVGIYLVTFHTRRRPGPKPVVLIHAGVAVVGVVLLAGGAFRLF
jgi:hypothetical protein